MERRLWIRYGDEPLVNGGNPGLKITKEFEELSARTGVSIAALEFLHHPVGIVVSGATHLTKSEQAIEDLNVKWAKELHDAGLI